MGRLFWKFLLSYWAAGLLAMLGMTTAVGLFQLAEHETEPTLESGPRATFLISAATATARHGGTTALADLMRDWQHRGDAVVYAVDAANHDLLGRTVPGDALREARAMPAGGHAPDGVGTIDTPGGRLLLLIPLDRPPAWRSLFPRRRPPSAWWPLTSGLLASLAFGTMLAWYVAHPIRKLRAAFAALSEGKLDTRVAAQMGRRRDEVADLGRDFDRMADQLQKLVTAQQALLHDVSHELRSPLARLQAAIGLARQDPQHIDASFERVEHEAQRLDDLVGQLLTLSRLEAGTGSASTERIERVDLIELVASICDDAHFEAQAGGRAVVFAGEGELVADVRVELLHRAFENVVRNAVKYTAPGTTVDVTTHHDTTTHTFLVRVCDRGPGVPDHELGAIFQPFYRSVSGVTGPGFGLGLAITQRAIMAHGGTVQASNREGGGLQLDIAVPLTLQRPAHH